jgi:hypothetical protein
MAELPNRRPHYMVKAIYEEPHRGYQLALFCGCGVDPMTGRFVEVFVRPGRVHDGEVPDMRDAMLERLCDDIGRLVSFHLQTGVFAEALRDRLVKGGGPGLVAFPGHASDQVDGLGSPLEAIVLAVCAAQADWNLFTRDAQQGRAGGSCLKPGNSCF